MANIIFGEIPKHLLGVDTNGNKALRLKKLTYDSTLSCDVGLADWYSQIIDVDVDGNPSIRVVELEEVPMTCDNVGDNGIEACGMFLGHLVMATDGKPALGLLTS